MTVPPKHIFISYKSQERAYARVVCDQVQAWGYTTWLDVDNLPPRAMWRDAYDWQHEIDAALKSAAGVLGIVTPQALASRYVSGEWDIALVRGIPFIPLLYESTPLPIKYRSLETLNFSGPDRDSVFEHLHERLERVLSQSLPPSDPYQAYLQALYDLMGEQLGQLMIKTFSTYGGRGQVGAEPLRLAAEMAQDSLSGRLEVGYDATSGNQRLDELDELLRRCAGQIILLGEAGSGKTITLLHFTRDAVVQRIQDPTAPLPIYANINSWNPNQYATLTEWLADTFAAPPDTSQLVQAGKTLLLLDGLDELLDEQADPSPGSPDPRLQFLAQLPTHNPLILTCRQEEFAEIAPVSSPACRVTLQPLSDNQIGEYLRDQPEVRAIIEADDALRQMLRTPLLLSFFAFAYEGMSVDERRQFEAVRSAGDLRNGIIGSYVLRRFAFEQSKPHVTLPYDLLTMARILGQLALETILGRRGENRMPKRAVQQVLGENPDLFLEQAQRLHLLVKLGGDNWRFIHLLVRDYFAFEPLVAALEDDSNPDLQKRAIRVSRRMNPLQVMAWQIGKLEAQDAQTRRKAADTLDHLKWQPDNPYQRVLYQIARQKWYDLNFFKLWEVRGEGRLAGVLATLLQDPYVPDHIRDAAAQFLGHLGEAGSSGLRDALCHQNALVRNSAIEGLSVHGPLAFGIFEQVLRHHPHAKVRLSAIHGLGRCQGIKVTDLLRLALKDKDAKVRTLAAEMLPLVQAKLGIPVTPPPESAEDRRLRQAATALRDHHQDVYLRRSAASTLKELKNHKEVIELLEIALHDQDELVRSHALATFHELAETEGLGPMSGRRAVSVLLDALQALQTELAGRDDEDFVPTERLSYLDSLLLAVGRWQDDRVFDTLVALLQHQRSEVRARSVDALGSLNDVRAVEPLLKLLQDANLGVRRDVALALGSLNDPRAIQPLVGTLYDEESWVREAAARALAQLQGGLVHRLRIAGIRLDAYLRRKVAFLKRAKNDHRLQGSTDGDFDHEPEDETSPIIQVPSPTDAILEEAANSTLDYLIHLLGDASPATRESAAAELGEQGDTQAVPALVTALQDKHPYVRSSVASALGMLGDPQAVEALVMALKDTQPYVRSNAAEALGQLGDRRAIEPLQVVLQDVDSDVRRAAGIALANISEAH